MKVAVIVVVKAIHRLTKKMKRNIARVPSMLLTRIAIANKLTNTRQEARAKIKARVPNQRRTRRKINLKVPRSLLLARRMAKETKTTLLTNKLRN